MSAAPKRVSRRSLQLAICCLAFAGTAGCVRIGAKPPLRLLAVSSDARLAPGAPQSGAAQSALFVEMPGVPRSIATLRVAVRADSNSFAYVPKALWVDLPARQFQSLLGETIAARTGRLVLDPAQYPSQVGQILHGELIEFGVDAAAHQAVVAYDASVLGADGLTVRRQRFMATAPVASIEADTVAPAVSKAANEVAVAVADWIAKP